MFFFIVLAHGLQVVTREVHRSSLRRLMCHAQDRLIFLTLLIISDFCPLSEPDVGLCILEHTVSILVCAAASLFCACLVSVQVYAPYVLAGSTH